MYAIQREKALAITLIKNTRLKVLFNRPFFIFCSLNACFGALWLYHGDGIYLAPMMILIIRQGQSFKQRWLLALCYFAFGSWGLVQAYDVFFASPHSYSALLCWALSVIVLSAPWGYYTSLGSLLLITTIEALPPLGLIGWLSPIHSLGWWFPGCGQLCLILCPLTLMVLHRPTKLNWFILMGLIGLFNMSFKAPSPPSNWLGVKTSIPATMYSLNQFLNERHHLVEYLPLPLTKHNVVFPETFLSNWYLGTRRHIEQYPWPKNTLILVGATVDNSDGQEDAIVAINQGKTEEEPWFYCVFPVPLSMWHPFTHGGYHAHWWPLTRVIDQLKVNAIICYDQLLPWPWLSFLITKPQLILALSNEWWSKNSSVPDIQQRCREAWSRLLDVPIIEARNLPILK